jgi:hypothetical protein
MPNNFQPQVPTFEKGERLTAAKLTELADAVSRLLWQKQQATNATFSVNRPLNVQVMLKEDLFAAVDTKTDPSTAEAYTLAKRGSNLVNTGRTITIVNRFENISVDAGTYAKAEWIDGEWQLYAADCGTESVSVGGGTSGGGGPDPDPDPDP